MTIAARLDDIGKPAWIGLMVLSFILFWPAGLVVLGYLIGSGRMGCWAHGRDGRWRRGMERMQQGMEQMRGGGGVLSFEVDGTGEDAKRFSEALHLFTLAPSLGGVDSLVTIPVLTSHGMISAEHRAKMGVTDQLVRLSVGIENAGDLIADLEQALTTVTVTSEHAQVG